MRLSRNYGQHLAITAGLAVLLLLCTSLITSCIGVTGLYIARIFEQIKGRPLYVIDEVIPFKPAHGQRPSPRGDSAES